MLLKITQQKHQRANVCSQIAYGRVQTHHYNSSFNSSFTFQRYWLAYLFFWHAHVSMQYAYLWVHVYGVIHAYVSMKARGWGSMSSSIFLHFIYLGRVFLLTLGLSDSARLANQLALGSPCLCLKCCWDNRCLTHPDLTWILGTWILLLTLGLQALFQPSYCP